MGSVGTLYESGQPKGVLIPISNADRNVDNWNGLSDSAKEYLGALQNPQNSGYTYETSGGKAFIRLDEGPLSTIVALGSTGGNAGTQALISAFQKTLDSDINKHGIRWVAENDQAAAYYTHLGLGKYGNDFLGQTEYRLNREQLNSELKRLKKKYK